MKIIYSERMFPFKAMFDCPFECVFFSVQTSVFLQIRYAPVIGGMQVHHHCTLVTIPRLSHVIESLAMDIFLVRDGSILIVFSQSPSVIHKYVGNSTLHRLKCKSNVVNQTQIHLSDLSTSMNALRKGSSSVVAVTCTTGFPERTSRQTNKDPPEN